MEEHNQPIPQDKEPELKQPDEAVKDLEPEQEEGENVKGGGSYAKIEYKG